MKLIEQLAYLAYYSRQKIAVYPELQREINNIVQRAINKIEAGESFDYEVQLAIQTIDDLIYNN